MQTISNKITNKEKKDIHNQVSAPLNLVDSKFHFPLGNNDGLVVSLHEGPV